MGDPPTVDRDSSRQDHARKLLWPVAVAAFLVTFSYPVLDFAPPPSPPDVGLGMLLVYGAVAAVTVGVVFGLVLPRTLGREGSGVVALALATVGTLLAPGFWTGVPPGLAAGGALLGWAGMHGAKGHRLSHAAFVTGLLGVSLNAVSYAEVFL